MFDSINQHTRNGRAASAVGHAVRPPSARSSAASAWRSFPRQRRIERRAQRHIFHDPDRFLIATFSEAYAQDAVFGRGDAVVTGFSGIKPPMRRFPQVATRWTNSSSISTGHRRRSCPCSPGGPPAGQLSAPALLQIKAREVGQVFAMALDDGLDAQVRDLSWPDLRIRPEYRAARCRWRWVGGAHEERRAGRTGWPDSSAPTAASRARSTRSTENRRHFAVCQSAGE